MDRGARWVSNLWPSGKACPALCGGPGWNRYPLVRVGPALPGRGSHLPFNPALFALFSGMVLGYRWGALVIFSFQFSKAAQDVGCPSVIMPSLRLNSRENLSFHDPRARRIIT